MLVLNTNNQGGGGYTLSNEFLEMYPDFQNSILVIPPTSVNWTLPETHSVNGTKINFRSWTLTAPNFWNNSTDAGRISIWWWSWANYDRTTNFRVWIPNKLNWWEIIWKKLIWWVAWVFTSSQWWSSTTMSVRIDKLDYIVKLLHSDWTLTTIWTVAITGEALSWMYANQERYYQYDNVKTVETSWVVAQEWDLIVVDYDVKIHCQTTSTSYWGTGNLLLWYKMTSDDLKRIRPLQISID